MRDPQKLRARISTMRYDRLMNRIKDDHPEWSFGLRVNTRLAALKDESSPYHREAVKSKRSDRRFFLWKEQPPRPECFLLVEVP